MQQPGKSRTSLRLHGRAGFHNACLMYYHCSQHACLSSLLSFIALELLYACTALYHYTLIIMTPAKGLHFSALVLLLVYYQEFIIIPNELLLSHVYVHVCHLVKIGFL